MLLSILRTSVLTHSKNPAVHQPSPTEVNTPSEHEEDTQGSSAKRRSFSSLINYDPSSQMTNNPAFKSVSNAETLRLRLRIAAYKMRTNQVDVPFDDLLVENKSRTPSVQEAVANAVAELRREAQEIAARDSRRAAPQSAPKLLPAPVLRPTAYSSRMIYEMSYPSSPPLSRYPDGLPSMKSGSTPYRDTRHLTSPPSSAELLARPSEQELTSSVVKGRVAEGLLGLRHAV